MKNHKSLFPKQNAENDWCCLPPPNIANAFVQGDFNTDQNVHFCEWGIEVEYRKFDITTNPLCSMTIVMFECRAVETTFIYFYFCDGVRLCLCGTGSLTGPLSISRMIHEWIWSNGGIILTGENRRTRRKTCPSATLSTTNPTWTDLGTNRSSAV
jgi:hypothetical protein